MPLTFLIEVLSDINYLVNCNDRMHLNIGLGELNRVKKILQILFRDIVQIFDGSKSR